MITVAQFHNIKHCIERERLSQRATARKLNISRNSVKKYLAEEKPKRAIDRNYGAESHEVKPSVSFL
jgi:predicted transcriptional regulator